MFKNFTTNEIKPKGWLLDQLRIQANGLSGNLDKMWPDIRDSKWIGGNKEGWERVPYWLDGFIPLAYLLENEDMIKRAKKYIDSIIEKQCRDGWICPCSYQEREHYDMWALFLMLKVLIVYYECSNDPRIEQVIYRALKNYYNFIKGHTLNNWASARYYECVIAINWLYERRKERWLIDLAHILEGQGIHYNKMTSFLRKKTKGWDYYHHVVNLAMSLKSDAVMSVIDQRNPNTYPEKMLKLLQKYHGNVNKYFNGDECLSGSNPNRGTELCGVVEAMYSYETITKISEKSTWMDYCELLAFNAFPGTLSEDMWVHQYNQLSNQPYCVKLEKEGFYSTNNSESNIFGLEPHFGCCTANHNQGFPKFVLSTFMKADDGIVINSLCPSSLQTIINDTTISIDIDSLYPFRENAKIHIKTSEEINFNLYIRIPGFFDKVLINNQEVKTGEYYIINSNFKEETIEIQLVSQPKLVKRHSLYHIVKGGLIYVLPIKERWEKHEYTRDGVERKYPYCDYFIFPESEWEYGFSSSELEYGEKDDYHSAFSTTHPLCFIKAKVKKISWGFDKKYKYIAASTPHSTIPLSEEKTIEFIPYGCSQLRMSELPLLKEHKNG